MTAHHWTSLGLFLVLIVGSFSAFCEYAGLWGRR